ALRSSTVLPATRRFACHSPAAAGALDARAFAKTNHVYTMVSERLPGRRAQEAMSCHSPVRPIKGQVRNRTLPRPAPDVGSEGRSTHLTLIGVSRGRHRR